MGEVEDRLAAAVEAARDSLLRVAMISPLAYMEKRAAIATLSAAYGDLRAWQAKWEQRESLSWQDGRALEAEIKRALEP